MENRGAEPDDLEIASIGSLYVGQWNKKYWSCSRGRDRYPYPVGYRAIRTHAGSTYEVEVCEGLKGPLFVITVVDGCSFNGQTPDIAWENFQKNNHKSKNWNGKRLSHKIDGTELEKFLDTENKVFNPNFSSPKHDCGDLSALESFSDVCISDTCDTIIAEILPTSSKLHSLEAVSKDAFKDDILDNGIYDGVAKDSLPEVSFTGSFGQSSEDADLDLAGQELTKSMMTFLLPRAVPLLKKTYVRRRSRARHREANVDPCSTSTAWHFTSKNAVNDHVNKIVDQGNLVAVELAQLPEMIMKEAIDTSKTLSRVRSNCDFNITNAANEPLSGNKCSKDLQSVIPDSFENDMSYCASMKTDEVKELMIIVFEPANHNPPAKGANEELISNSTENSNHLYELCFKSSQVLEKNTSKTENFAPNNLIFDKLIDNEISKKLYDNHTSFGCFEGRHEVSVCGEPIGNLVAVELSPLPEMIRKEAIDTSKSLSRDSSNCNFNITNAANEPLSGNKCSKDLQSVIPDSFENDMSYCASMKTDEVKELMIIVSEPAKHNPPAKEANEELISNSTENSNHLNELCFRSSQVLEKNTSKTENFAPNSLIFDKLIDNESSKKLYENQTSFRCFEGRNEDSVFGETIGEKDGHFSLILPKDDDVAGGIRIDTKGTRNFTSVPISIASLSETIVCRNVNNYDVRGLNLAGDFQDEDKKVAGIMNVPQPNHFSLPFRKESVDSASDLSMPEMHSLLRVKRGIKKTPEKSKQFTNSHSYRNFRMAWSDLNLDLQPVTNNNAAAPSHGELCNSNLFDGSLIKRLSWIERSRHMELVGCYLHPEPVLFIMLTVNKNHLQLSVLCGFPDRKIRHLFMYTISIQEQRGCPSFLGYVPLFLPLVSNPWNRNIPFERSALQFTPDGQFLIFISSIEVPRCREQKISCLCSNCKSVSSKKTTLEIVSVNFGYVSRLTKLTTLRGISCISVCEPNYLVAAEEDGGLHVWVMSLMWSDILEEFMLPTCNGILPMILELKRIPSCNSLIIGHNGFGYFGLWELSKRVLLAKFSSPDSTISNFIPVSMFNQHATQSSEHVMKSMLKSNCQISLGSSFEDISIWVFISTVPNLEAESEIKGLGPNPGELWRLALLTKNIIIVGNILDPSATAVAASADSGVIGTSDGLLYQWELSSGRKLGNLASIQCGVSCVAFDSRSGALAVSGTDSRLQVFIES